MMLHPIYDNEDEVRRLTREHIKAGRTVLQMFQLADSEDNHSMRVLDMLGLPQQKLVRILSLGCGVGGMESYWAEARPEYHFELVNRSQAQLDLAVCPGDRVCADAMTYRSKRPPFDVTVLAYVLGHLDADMALESAAANTRKGGLIVVLDVFDGSVQFDQFFSYETCTTDDMRSWGYTEKIAAYPWRLIPLIHHESSWVPRHCTPAIWVRGV